MGGCLLCLSGWKGARATRVVAHTNRLFMICSALWGAVVSHTLVLRRASDPSGAHAPGIAPLRCLLALCIPCPSVEVTRVVALHRRSAPVSLHAPAPCAQNQSRLLEYLFVGATLVVALPG